MFLKPLILASKKLELLSAASIRLTKLTGKSKYPIHPKHLVKKTPWYQRYLSKRDILLDVGCGLGQHSIDAAPKVKKVVAFDLYKEVVETAAKRTQEAKRKNIKFDIVNAEKKLPYIDNSFSSLLCLDVLEHLKNESFAIREIKRVLKPNGKLFLSLPNGETSWKKLQKSLGLFYYSDPDHKREYSKSEIEHLCAKHNFAIKFIKPVTLDTPLAPIFDLIGGFSLSLYKKLGDWKRKQAIKKPKESVGFIVYAVNNKSLAI